MYQHRFWYRFRYIDIYLLLLKDYGRFYVIRNIQSERESLTDLTTKSSVGTISMHRPYVIKYITH